MRRSLYSATYCNTNYFPNDGILYLLRKNIYAMRMSVHCLEYLERKDMGRRAAPSFQWDEADCAGTTAAADFPVSLILPGGVIQRGPLSIGVQVLQLKRFQHGGRKAKRFHFVELLHNMGYVRRRGCPVQVSRSKSLSKINRNPLMVCGSSQHSSTGVLSGM